jgi:hypothetical protein
MNKMTHKFLPLSRTLWEEPGGEDSQALASESKTRLKGRPGEREIE